MDNTFKALSLLLWMNERCCVIVQKKGNVEKNISTLSCMF